MNPVLLHVLVLPGAIMLGVLCLGAILHWRGVRLDDRWLQVASVSAGGVYAGIWMSVRSQRFEPFAAMVAMLLLLAPTFLVARSMQRRWVTHLTQRRTAGAVAPLWVRVVVTVVVVVALIAFLVALPRIFTIW